VKAALVVSLAVLGGCLPTLSAQSAAPPSRAARLDAITGFWGQPKAYRLELSQGVAIAMTCNKGGPCRNVRLASDDPSIAEVRMGALSKLEVVSYDGNQQTSSALVVVGKAPGSTTIRVRTAGGGQDIHVTIISPPTSNPQTAVTR
jgi:hypothetical protein